MRRTAALGALLAVLAAPGCGSADAGTDPRAARGASEPRFDVLVFSRTTAFRHSEAIAAGRERLAALGAAHGFSVTATETLPDDLDRFAVIVLLQTNGEDVVRDRAGFARWLRAGGGVVAIHAAANADRDWPFYGRVLGGARFRNHPPGDLQFQAATVHVRDAAHPATKAIPRRWRRTDEWYNFDPEPGPRAHVLATLDEAEYDEVDGTAAGDPHPIAWTARVGRGRSLYTALGHGGSAWDERAYRAHVLGAVEWAAGG